MKFTIYDLASFAQKQLRHGRRLTSGRNFLAAFCISAFCVLHSAFATDFNHLTNNTRIVNFSSSWDASPYHLYFDYVWSALVNDNPTVTLHINTAAHGGGGIEDAQIREEKNGIGHWGYQTNGDPIIMFFHTTSNNSNEVYTNMPLVLQATTNLWNGTIFTNEGGWCATSHLYDVVMGMQPNETSDGDSTYRGGNDAAGVIASNSGVTFVDWWHQLITSWSNDFAGQQLVWSGDPTHPAPAGHLNMAIALLQSIGVETNVWSASVDWSATVNATNHCYVSGVSQSGNTLSFTVRLDRMGFAYDVPDATITNDARPAFAIKPEDASAFNETVIVTGLPTANYNLMLDGALIDTASAAQLAAGRNLFTNYNGALWAQKKEVLGRIRDKHGTDRVTLLDHSAGVNGIWGPDLVNYDSFANSYWATQTERGNKLIADLDPIEATLSLTNDVQINLAAQQTNHTLTISQVLPLCAPFHR
jgi:hypothetical protein